MQNIKIVKRLKARLYFRRSIKWCLYVGVSCDEVGYFQTVWVVRNFVSSEGSESDINQLDRDNLENRVMWKWKLKVEVDINVHESNILSLLEILLLNLIEHIPLCYKLNER